MDQGKKIKPAADEVVLSAGLRQDADTSRYASLAAFPPCQCGADICPDRQEPAEATAGEAAVVRERLRETNRRNAFYRLP